MLPDLTSGRSTLPCAAPAPPQPSSFTPAPCRRQRRAPGPARRGGLRRLSPCLAAAALLSLGSVPAAGALQGNLCRADNQAIAAAISRLEKDFFTEPDVSCGKPASPGQTLLCRDKMSGVNELWDMSRLADLAFSYASAGSDSRRHDADHPPRDQDFIAERDSCTTIACLCKTLIGQTDDSLGSESPYPRPEG